MARTHTTRRPPLGEAGPRFRRTLAILLSAVLGVMGLISIPTAALAATEATIDSIAFTSETFPGGSAQEIRATWSVPDYPDPPVTVRVPLPDELRGYSDRFPAESGGGGVAGHCVVSAEEVVCQIDDSFVVENPRDISGAFTFLVDIRVYNTEQEERTFTFGSVTAPPITLTPNLDVCVADCSFTGTWGWKGGSYENRDDTIGWTVGVEAPAEGIPSGRRVTVTDLLDLDVYEVVEGPLVQEAGSFRKSSWTQREYPVWEDLSPALVDVSGDRLSVAFDTRAGRPDDHPETGDRGIPGSIYQVYWKVKVLDEGRASEYRNRAEWTVEGTEKRSVEGTVVHQSGSGNVVGRDCGAFSVTKLLAGDVTFDTPPEFALSWVAYAEGGDADGVSGETTLSAGETFTSAEFPRGTRVVLTEVSPTGPEGVRWGTPQFVATDESGEPLPGAQPTDRVELVFTAENGNLSRTSHFALTNTATRELPTLDTAPVLARKTVVNPDAIQLPESAEYTLHYRYPAGDTWDAGSGSLILPADGSVVTSDELPVGAVLELSEGTPAALPGAAWEAPVIRPERLVVGDDREVVIDVINTITATDPPVPPSERGSEPQASPRGSTEPPALARTGSAPSAILGLSAALALLGLGIAGAGSRARRLAGRSSRDPGA